MSELNERRAEEKERRRAEIVQAAEDLARERGWDNVTVANVAQRARLSRALVYLYFKDKSDLHAALWERACDALCERFTAVVERFHTGYERLEAMGNAYVGFAQEMPHYFEAISRFEARVPDTTDSESGELRALQRQRRVHELMVQTIEAGFEDGSIRKGAGSPHLIAVSLWGFTHGIIQIATTKGSELAQEGVSQENLVRQAFSLIAAALRTD